MLHKNGKKTNLSTGIETVGWSHQLFDFGEFGVGGLFSIKSPFKKPCQEKYCKTYEKAIYISYMYLRCHL